MEVIFRTRQLQRNYRDFARAARQWGPVVGREFINCIDILESTTDIQEVYRIPSFRLHPLRGTMSSKLSIYLTGRWRLIVTEGDMAQSIIIEEVSNHYDD